MRVLFPYPREFGYFPDIYEYVTLLRSRGVDAYYVGLAQEQASDKPSYAAHLTGKAVTRGEFIRFTGCKIRTIRPDIVHTFHFRGCGLLPFLAPSVPSKWLVDVRTIHVETRDLRITPDFWLRDRLTWLETQSYDHIFALTETIQQKLKPSLRPIERVPLGASKSRLTLANKEQNRLQIRNELDIPIDVPVLLYAGSLSPTRRLDRILGGFALVLDRFPDARFLMVGGKLGFQPENDPLILSLEETATKLGIISNVLFTGRVPYSRIPLYLAASDTGISYMPLGTPHQHQPPTKLIEYMMAGILAASNRIPAINGLLLDNHNGILFGESVDEIAQGFHRALELLCSHNREILLRLTANAQESVADRDWQCIVDRQLIPLYERLVEKKS